MKSVLSNYLCGLLVSGFLTFNCFQGLVYGQSFEGIVDFVITNENEKIKEETKITWHKKGNDHRLDVRTTSPQVSYEFVILLRDKSGVLEMLTNVEGTKNVYTVPLEKIEGMDLSMVGASQNSLGEEEISGYNCRKLEVQNQLGNVKYWLTKDLTIPLNDFPHFFRKANYFRFLETSNIEGVPIKIISSGPTGEAQYSQTITKVSPKQINNSIFSIPSDYTPITTE